MPKKTYPKSLKAKSKGPWPTPKRGKRRANMKKPASKTMKSSTTVSYVRHGEITTKSRAHRARWGHSIQNFSAMPYKNLLRTLQRDGILPKWKGQVCPRCGMGKLGKLKFVKSRKQWMHQCSSRGCKKYLQPDDFHPIFFRGAGSSVTPLHVQVCIFYAALAGVSVNSAHLILNTDHKAVERLYSNLDAARARYVEHKEKSITYGSASGDLWRDVEADEVDVGKALEEDSDQKPKLRWEQWCGIVERGRPSSLRLFRLEPPLTAPRAPGPGPIRKHDWSDIGKKLLRDRHVVLHTDGARAYKLRIPGVMHCNVVHKKKRITINKKVGA